MPFSCEEMGFDINPQIGDCSQLVISKYYSLIIYINFYLTLTPLAGLPDFAAPGTMT